MGVASDLDLSPDLAEGAFQPEGASVIMADTLGENQGSPRLPPKAALAEGPPRTRTGRCINRAKRTTRHGRTTPRRGAESSDVNGLWPAHGDGYFMGGDSCSGLVSGLGSRQGDRVDSRVGRTRGGTSQASLLRHIGAAGGPCGPA
jgi:hypothetical protein